MDKFATLRASGTSGLNHDLETDDIIRQLSDWDRRFGLDVLKAAEDSATIRFKRLPEDLEAFLEDELMDFCPDTVFQNFDGPAELLEHLTETQTLVLWWD